MQSSTVLVQYHFYSDFISVKWTAMTYIKSMVMSSQCADWSGTTPSLLVEVGLVVAVVVALVLGVVLVVVVVHPPPSPLHT